MASLDVSCTCATVSLSPRRVFAAAILTVDVHRWQHHGHLGSASFVVAGGRKEEVVLRTSRVEKGHRE